jgi:hypothetical protein
MKRHKWKSVIFNKAKIETQRNQKMSSEDTLFNAMMQTSVTSDSSTLSGLATGPIPGSALGVGSAPGFSIIKLYLRHIYSSQIS